MNRIRNFIKAFIGSALILSGVTVHAQGSLIQNALDKLASHKNYSYQSVYKQRDYTSDTLVMEHRDIFSKAPADSAFGYLFSLETFIRGNKFPYTDLYNGQGLLHITPEDSTYTIKKAQASAVQGTLPDYLKMLERLYEKRPYEMDQDTTIDGAICAHLILKTYDTLVDKEHYYTRIHLFINKSSGLPDCIIARSRNARIGNGINDYYGEYRYSHYKFDQETIDLASMTFPRGFHPPKQRPAPPALLSPGKPAPDWVLYSEEGKKVSLSALKGKIVLLDFFFIGCEGCMLSLKPLNRLHEKYNDRGVTLVSMTFRDSKESVKEFKKNYKIHYPIYLNAGNVVKSYNVEQFPTFYFIDKDGKITSVMVGYNDDFEEKVTSIIDNLLHN